MNDEWRHAPSTWNVDLLDVHVWLVNLAQMSAHLANLIPILSDDERRRAERFYFEPDRHRYVLARGLLRVLLGSYSAYAPSKFSYGTHGKPRLAGVHGETDPRFNVSQSGNYILIALANQREVGIDIEYINELPDMEKIAERFFSVREHTLLSAVPAPEKSVVFFTYWTRKEAYIKATGDGMAMPLDQCDMSHPAADPGESVSAVHVQRRPGETSRWSVYALPEITGYASALVIEGHAQHLHCWQLTPRQIPGMLHEKPG